MLTHAYDLHDGLHGKYTREYLENNGINTAALNNKVCDVYCFMNKFTWVGNIAYANTGHNGHSSAQFPYLKQIIHQSLVTYRKKHYPLLHYSIAYGTFESEAN